MPYFPIFSLALITLDDSDRQAFRVHHTSDYDAAKSGREPQPRSGLRRSQQTAPLT